MSMQVAKICVKCGQDVAGKKRVKDPQGRYYCEACYEAAQRTAPADDNAPDVNGEIDLAIAATPEARPQRSAAKASTLPAKIAPGTGVVCPCCAKEWDRSAKICTECGIRIPSGRPMITGLGRDENLLYGNAEQIIQWISWVMRMGLYPIASEAYATRKPIVIWFFAGLMTLTSLWFFVAMRSDSNRQHVAQLMLWPVRHEMPARHKVSDAEILAKYKQLQNDPEGKDWREAADDKDAPWASQSDDQRLISTYRVAEEALEQDDAPAGTFRWYQLFTNTLLHDPDSIFDLVMHLGGNMLFLLIFGTRVNALIGNAKMAVVYPLLAVLASGAQLLFTPESDPRPALGASGAIMGLAGMYLIFFPVHRVYMAFWWRFWWWRPAWIKIWVCRGFWVLGFYIAFDVVATLLRSEDGVAHWAHLGGFISGMAIAMVMLVARLQDARHSDLLSVLFGRFAWPLIGRPQPLIRGIVVGENGTL